jgi:hypothetical protein
MQAIRYQISNDHSKANERNMTDKHHTRAVIELVARSGILKKLADEDEERRAAQHAGLRQRKAAAVVLYQKQMPAADAAVAAADKKADDARKLANDAMQEYIAARGKQDAVRGTFIGTTEPIDREMLTCYDPAIDAFKAELKTLQDGCATLFRLSEDRKTDNSAAIDARVRALIEARDAADRLKIDSSANDVPAALAAIRKSIPEA